jgi:hypothetical protein
MGFVRPLGRIWAHRAKLASHDYPHNALSLNHSNYNAGQGQN